MRALVVSGAGRYADPWHPFDRTSPRIVSILSDAGFETSLSTDIDGAMTTLEGISLLVVNAGDPWRSETGTPAPTDAARAGFSEALERGIGVVAVHCAVASMRDYPDWFAAIGGMWVPGLSFHPPASETTISTTVPGLKSFDVLDECYCRLQQVGRRTEVAHHSASGGEAVGWIRRYRQSRIAVDTLGHDERSYDSAGHRRLFSALARWTVGDETTLAEG